MTSQPLTAGEWKEQIEVIASYRRRNTPGTTALGKLADQCVDLAVLNLPPLVSAQNRDLVGRAFLLFASYLQVIQAAGCDLNRVGVANLVSFTGEALLNGTASETGQSASQDQQPS